MLNSAELLHCALASARNSGPGMEQIRSAVDLVEVNIKIRVGRNAADTYLVKSQGYMRKKNFALIRGKVSVILSVLSTLFLISAQKQHLSPAAELGQLNGGDYVM